MSDSKGIGPGRYGMVEAVKVSGGWPAGRAGVRLMGKEVRIAGWPAGRKV